MTSVRAFRKNPRDRHHRPNAAEIGKRRQHRDFGFVFPQNFFCRRHVWHRAHALSEVSRHRREVILRHLCQNAAEPIQIERRQHRQKQRAVERTAQQVSDLRIAKHRGERGRIDLRLRHERVQTFRSPPVGRGNRGFDDAGGEARFDGLIHAHLGAAPDHAMTVNFPEGEYLKGLAVLRFE